MTPTPASARLKRMLLATSLLGLSAPALARAAPVLPTGGKVVSGTAAIGAAGAGGLTITQSSNKAIINWSGFSIGQGGKVQFDNGKGATLNRVTGGSVSAIDGLLGATGSVYVINPNGVIIGKTGVVNVGGTFVASTLDISDADFLSGGALGFSGPSTASVINLGKVGALGGDVALIGATVENDGAITAANGSAGLIAGHSVVMLRDASLDEGRFSVLLGGAGTSATNVGVIQAAAAELRAEGGNVYALAGDTSGVIRATGVKSGGGKIWLTAEGGTAQVDGTLEAQGPGGTPGAIETSAGMVALAPKVDIDSHGGTWLLDPYDVTISTAPDTAGSPGSAPTQTTNVNTTTLDNALADNSVVISTGAAGGAGSDAGNITVAAPVAWSSGASLTLTAANAIAVNAPITIGGAGQLALNTGMVAVGSSTQPLLSFAQGAAVSFTGSEGSGQALSINGTGYALVYSMAELAALNNTSGDDALAVSLTPATTYTSSVIDTFSGTLEGLGHTITGLTINDSGGYEVGLVGNLTRSATVRDLGLLGVDISGSQVVGGLAGGNEGTISQSYVTGVVGGTENFDGGLVADNTGTIAQSYANVAVSGTNTAGGLVGQNGGTIVASYASGPVVGSEDAIGGLVGENGGSITQSYATGAVGGSSGGLVGENGGTITTSYFDTQTTGQSSGVGFQQPGGGTPTGLTTAQFQSGSASGLGSAFAGGIGGLYPYLANFFPNGVQAVSGVAYSDAAGTAPLASTSAGAVTVSLDGGGAQIGQASTGANGYYYVAVPAGTLASGEAVLASTPAVTATGATDSATLALSTGAGAQAGLNLYPSTLTIQTAQTLLSTSPTLATAIAAAGADAGAAAVVNGTTGIGYDALGSSFTIDQAVSTSGGFSVATGSDDPLTVGAPITLGSGGALSLLSGGALAVDAPISVDGSAPVTLAYDASSPTNLSFAQGSALTFANSDGSAATAPVTGQSLTVNGTAYTLVYTLAELNGIDAADNGTGAVQYGAGLAGDYALTSSLVLAGTTYTQAPIASVGGTTFSGILEGLGHTLTGLTVSASGADSVGLIGTLFGTVRDLGLLNGTVIGKYDVGALAGGNYGTIVQTYATGAVSGTNQVGGLVGLNGGAITQAYATGAVSGQGNVGGLAGENAGTITQAYATGAVSGGGDVGGLVGANTGAIAQAYATGAVSGSNGGLVGGNFGGTLADGYYDTQTTGQTSDGGGATGLTTAQLQGTGTPTGFSLGSSFSGGVAGGRAGIYPYLTSFFPNGVQALSGTAYNDRGVTPLASGTDGTNFVYVDLAGTAQASVSTGANGYYYVAVPAGTLAFTGTPLLAYTTGTASAADPATGALLLNAHGGRTGLDIWGATLVAPTSAASVSTAPISVTALLADSDTLAAMTNAQLLAAAGGSAASLSGLAQVGYVATNPSGFALDQLSAPGDLYVLGALGAGPLTVTAPLTLSGTKALTLESFAALAVDAPVTVTGAGVVTLATGFDPTTGLPELSFAEGASLSFSGTNTDGSAAGALTINTVPYTLVNSLAELNGIDAADNGTGAAAYGAGLDGNYALATQLDASATSYSLAPIAPGGAVFFDGTLEGLGHVISGLTIASSGDYTGLVGSLGGTVRDIGLVGGSVTGNDYVGALVGQNEGTVTLSYSSSAVSGADDIGGLVGQNTAAIIQAYATGPATGSQSVGGLVGENFLGMITQAYATGAVSGSEDVGGLIGYTVESAITQAYATGPVSGTAGGGGLAGYTSATTVSNSYFDTQTTGSGLGGGRVGAVTGETTAQLQAPTTSGAPILGSGFAGGAASGPGGEAGVYPYLISFFPNGVQALTTTASGAAGASAAGGQVAFYANGGALGQGTASVGANGYVYQAVAAGTVAAGSALGATLTLPGAMAVGGLSFTDAPVVSGAVMAGAPLTAGVLAATTAQTTYSGLLGELNLTFGAADYQAATASLAAADFDITADGGFTVDQAISGAGSATIAAGGALTTTAPVTSTAGNVALASTGGDLTLDGAVSAAGGVVSLTSSGAIVASAPVTAQTLTGSAVEAASFTQGQIATLGSFTAGAGLTLVDLADLTVAGQVDGGSASTLTTTGTMTLTPGSSVSALGPVTLLAGRDIDVSGAIISTGGRPVRLNADTAVAGAGTVNFDPGASVTTGGPVTILYNPGTYGGSSATTRAGNPFSADISGGGVQTIRMLVDTPTQLQGIGAELDGLYQLNAGLQLSGTFTPIGSVAAPFTGLLDGLSLAIDGLRVDRLTPTGAGLFGAVGASGVVQNLILTNVNVTGTGYTGGLVGDLSGSLSNVSIDFGSVTGLGGTGGLVGVAEAGSSIVGSTTFVTVTSSAGNDVGGLAGANFGSITGSEAGGPVTASIGSHVGGLIGSNYGMISNDQATGAVQGAEYVGGLVGLNYGTVSGAATGSVGGTEYVGGLVGWNDTAGTISDSTASGVVSASTPAGLAVLGAGDYAGGLVGVNKGAVSNVSASTGTVAGVDDVGGLVGLNQGALGGAASMTLSAAGAVSGRNAVGGLAGWNDTGATITDGLATGAVTASGNYGGGLVGVNYGTVTGGTATGAVMGAAYTGGFAGWNATGGAISGGAASGATVSGSEYVGGFAGWQSVASLKSDTATGAVTDTGDYAGGLVGVNQGGVSGSLALGSSVSGVNIVGGLVGLNQGLIGSGDASGQVSADISTAAISGSTMLGGLVGYNDRNGAINIAYATGAVTGASGVSGNDYAGGLVGVNYGTITNTYATGQVSGTNVVGGLVGTNQAGGSVNTSYTTGKVTATGAAVGGVLGVNAGEVSYVYGFPALSGQAVQTAYQAPTASGQPTALSTLQEDGSAAYAGFDFTNTWQANPDGPPTLKDAPTPPAP